MMPVEWARQQKLRSGGMSLAPLVQILGILRTTGNARFSQNHAAKEESVRDVFKETAINVTVPGQKHLGALIGSREYLEEYVSEKVSNWINEVPKLAEFALSQPQACLTQPTPLA